MTTEAIATDEGVGAVTLTQRQRDDMTVVECLLDAGMEITNPIGWHREGSAFVFGVRAGGNRKKFEQLVEQRFDNASGHVQTDRWGKHYAVVYVEPTKSDWDELFAANASFAADLIKGGDWAGLDDWPKTQHEEVVRRIDVMSESEKFDLLKRLTAERKVVWELNTREHEIFPYWDFSFCGLEPGDIR